MTDDQDLDHTAFGFGPNEPIYLCLFALSGCPFSSNNIVEWKSHCTGHCNEEDLSPSMECFLCEFRADTTEEATAWIKILDHTAVGHRSGQQASRMNPNERFWPFVLQHGITSEKYISKKEIDPDGSSSHFNSAASRPGQVIGFRDLNTFERNAEM
jgi:hypothetical protein